MTVAVMLAFSLTAILLGGALLVVWSRRRTWLRPAAIPLALAAAVASTIVVGSALGFAVPLIGGITAPAGEAPLMSAKIMVNDGIYATLDLPAGPRLYWIPWDKEMAEELQDMLSDPGNAGAKVVVPPFEFSWDIDRKPDFQPLPQPKVLPDKPVDSAPAAPRFAA